MKKTLTKAGALGALSVAALGIMSVSAMGFGGMGGNTLSADEIATRQTSMFTQQASLLGATVDEVKNAWAQGKSMSTLATEKGLTQEQFQAKKQALHLEMMKTHLTALVSKGVITQAQADKRLAFMKTKMADQKNFGHGGRHDGMGKGMGMGKGLGL